MSTHFLSPAFNNTLSRFASFPPLHDPSLPPSTTENPGACSSCSPHSITVKKKPGGNSDTLHKGQDITARERKQVLLSSQSSHSLPAVEEVNTPNLVLRVKDFGDRRVKEVNFCTLRTGTHQTLIHLFVCLLSYLLWHLSPATVEWHFLIRQSQWRHFVPAWIWFSASLRRCLPIGRQPSTQGCQERSGWFWLHGSQHQRPLDPGGQQLPAAAEPAGLRWGFGIGCHW